MHKYPRKASGLYKFVVGVARKYILNNWNVKVFNTVSEQAKRPYVILCNHQSNLDSFITASALYPMPLNYVIADYHYRNPITRLAFRLIGTIPKEQFYPDVNAIIEMKRVISRGDTLALFPAGQSSYTGSCTYIPQGIGRLIKLLHATVLHLHIDGAHLAYPKWDMSRIRKTEIHVSIQELLTIEQVQQLSEKQIYDIVCGALQFDDYEWQRKHMFSYKRMRKTEGMDDMLFRCPCCNSEFTMTAVNNQLTCGACKTRTTMNSYGFFSFEPPLKQDLDTYVKWYQWQVRSIAANMAADESYAFTCPSKMYIFTHNKRFQYAGTGELSISREGLLFYVNGEKAREFDLSNHPTVPFENVKYFEIRYHDELFRFVFDLKGAACKFVMMCELLYALSQKDMLAASGK